MTLFIVYYQDIIIRYVDDVDEVFLHHAGMFSSGC